MHIQENISLRSYNTFGIDVKARYFASFKNADELEELINEASKLTNPHSPLTPLILGGGSNVLFTKDFNGMVLKNEITGISEVHEDSDYVYVKVGAGENWHQFVLYCINRNWAGLENLSLIPGNVGASPMQNIGAYGVEITDVFTSLEAFDLKERRLVTFTKADCEFGYRESVFKHKYKDRFVILNVTFQLRKKPIFHTNYGAIMKEIERMGVKDLTIKAVSDAVIHIRSSKIPLPKTMGNAGSFFKNPSISKELYMQLKNKYENIVGHENADGTVKLFAGWLIEKCRPDGAASWKGFRRGDAGCHADQALVLINYGEATGTEILQLSDEIAESVEKKFEILLEKEVNII